MDREAEALTISRRESFRRDPARCPSDRGPRKAIKQTMVKRQPMAIDLAKPTLSYTFDTDGGCKKL
jgi:hypothetical protein